MKQIEIDGIKYDISLEKAIELGVIKPAFVPKCIGEHYRLKNTTYVYVIAQAPIAGDFVAFLSDIKSGGYFSEPIRVGNCSAITQKEWQAITGASDAKFERVNVIISSKSRE